MPVDIEIECRDDDWGWLEEWAARQGMGPEEFLVGLVERGLERTIDEEDIDYPAAEAAFRAAHPVPQHFEHTEAKLATALERAVKVVARHARGGRR